MRNRIFCDFMANNSLIIGIIVVLVIALIAILLYNNRYISGGTATPILLTDPPNVPAGTQAFVVSYSSVMVHTTGASGSGWVQASGSGTANLMALQNNSEVIGNANLAANSSIDMVSFVITSATITVNGTSHNVAVSNSTVTAQTQSNSKVSSRSAVVIDIAPTVYGSYNQSTATSNYNMVVSSRSVVVANLSVSSQIGTVVSLNSSLQANLRLP